MHILGCLFATVTAFSTASVNVITRKMQKINFAIMLFYYGAFAMPVMFTVLYIESQITGESVRLLNYTSEQYCWEFGVALINYLGLCFLTIASQNERSGFVSLLGYIGLVYAFIGDLLIFKDAP